MAKPKIVQPSKQQKNPKTYPADRYPFMALKPNQLPSDIQYFRDHAEAVSKLRAEVEQLQHQFRHISEDIRQNCTLIISDLGRLSRDGGVVERIVDPETGIRYRVELVRRAAA